MTDTAVGDGGSGPRRIDTHQHIVPPPWSAWLRGQGYFGGQAIPHWSVDSALELMEQLRIESAILSVGRPGVWAGDAAQARALAREVNEFSAAVARDTPGNRFGFFASLPVPDVDGALAELDYATGQLGADGVILLANVDGQYLGAPELDPLMEEFDRRGTVVFIHPTAPPGPLLDGVPPFSADFLLDTTRAALNLVRHDAMNRFPSVRMILSHGGGFVPYAAHRIAGLTPKVGSDRIDREDFVADLRKFYFDVALSAGPYSLPALLAFADPARIFYGSDWPYAVGDNAQFFAAQLDAYGLPDAQHAAICRDNAAAVFERFAGDRSGV